MAAHPGGLGGMSEEFDVWMVRAEHDGQSGHVGHYGSEAEARAAMPAIGAMFADAVTLSVVKFAGRRILGVDILRGSNPVGKGDADGQD